MADEDLSAEPTRRAPELLRFGFLRHSVSDRLAGEGVGFPLDLRFARLTLESGFSASAAPRVL